MHMSAGEARKIADRERKAMERAVQAKVEAMREDDNVYDVSYEGQGTSTQEVAATATDVKVRGAARCWAVASWWCLAGACGAAALYRLAAGCAGRCNRCLCW